MATRVGRRCPVANRRRQRSEADRKARAEAKIARAQREAAAKIQPEGTVAVRLRLLPSKESPGGLRFGEKRWWILQPDAPNLDSPSGRGRFVDIEARLGRKAWFWQEHTVSLFLPPGEYIAGCGRLRSSRVRFTVDETTTEITIDPMAGTVEEPAAREPGEDREETSGAASAIGAFLSATSGDAQRMLFAIAQAQREALLSGATVTAETIAEVARSLFVPKETADAPF